MSVNYQARNRVANWTAFFFLFILLLLMVSPLMLVTINSFKTETEFVQNGPLRLPESLSLESLTLAWNRLDYPTKLLNSLFISLASSLLAIVISLLNAFAMGIGRVRGATAFLIFFIVAITLPNEALIYPFYYMFKWAGLYDTRLSVILILAALNTAFGTYLLTSVFKAFPRELIEAAMIDGAGHFKLLWRMVVPIALPSLSVLFVFFFIWSFNEFFLPLIFLVSNDNQTVPLAIALTESERGVVITLQSAASLLGILPCILFFIFFQRTLTRGVTAGSVK
jgi:raffinose/stachyose/melibiose transport system permease protein